jgi:hypothetical protein
MRIRVRIPNLGFYGLATRLNLDVLCLFYVGLEDAKLAVLGLLKIADQDLLGLNVEVGPLVDFLDIEPGRPRKITSESCPQIRAGYP